MKETLAEFISLWEGNREKSSRMSSRISLSQLCLYLRLTYFFIWFCPLGVPLNPDKRIYLILIEAFKQTAGSL